jgi:hypothetical protein
MKQRSCRVICDSDINIRFTAFPLARCMACMRHERVQEDHATAQKDKGSLLFSFALSTWTKDWSFNSFYFICFQRSIKTTFLYPLSLSSLFSHALAVLSKAKQPTFNPTSLTHNFLYIVKNTREDDNHISLCGGKRINR